MDAPVLQTFRAKSRSPGVAACEKERVIVHWGRASELLGNGYRFRRTGIRFLPLASRSFFEWKDYVTWRRHENLQSSCRCGSIVRPLGHPLSMLLTSLRQQADGTLAPIVPLALTMMPLEGLLKMLFGMLF